MEIEEIKHHLLVDNIFEVIITLENLPKVYIDQLANKEDYLSQREALTTVYKKEMINSLDEIFNKDWSKY